MKNITESKIAFEHSVESKIKKETHKYFQEALSDFTYDAASGRAIRHLTDSGYTASQISELLNYPTPIEKIRRTITRHLTETGILLTELPVSPNRLQPVLLENISEEQLFSCLTERICKNGEENSYISCPFGIMYQTPNTQLQKALTSLTARETEYISGIEWQSAIMYHRLNRRMLEIGVQLAMNSDAFSFYFIRTKEKLQFR